MRRGRGVRYGVAAACAVALLLPGVAGAQPAPPGITTPYPAVAVEPGATATFDLDLTTAGPQRVDLAVGEVPEGWTADFSGGGFTVDGVTAGTDPPPELTLDVDVPVDAAQGSYQLVITATAGGAATQLPLSLRIADAVGGGSNLTAEATSLRGDAEASFSFTLTLANDTPQETTYALEAVGPEGWIVSVQPSAASLAATVTVPPGEETTLTAMADPPEGVAAGSYPITVRATGGSAPAELELGVEVTGTTSLTFSTPDDRLNAEVVAGRGTAVPLVITNSGSAPLSGVTPSSTPPQGWEVTYEPATLEPIPAGGTGSFTATITPPAGTVAGDYVVPLSAGPPEATEQLELRTTVRSSGVFGLVGIALIALAVAGLLVVFQRFGRR